MKKFEIRKDLNLHKGNSVDRRNQSKGNRATTRRALSALCGKLSDETEDQVREQLQLKTKQLAAMKEQERWSASRRYLVPQYAYIGECDEDESDDFVDYDGDIYGDPYFDNSDEVEISFENEEPGYFEEAEMAFDKHDRFPIISDELPVDKNDRGGLVLMDFLSWLDRQVGRLYNDVLADACEIAGKHWWLVRKTMRMQCTTSGKQLTTADGEDITHYFINEEGVLHRHRTEKQAPKDTITTDIKAWLNKRHIVTRGAHYYWCIGKEAHLGDENGNYWGSYRQGNELNSEEMNFFAALSIDVQVEILKGFKSTKDLNAQN